MTSADTAWPAAVLSDPVPQAEGRSAGILQSRGAALSIEEIVRTLLGRVLDRIADVIPWRPGGSEPGVASAGAAHLVAVPA